MIIDPAYRHSWDSGIEPHAGGIVGLYRMGGDMAYNEIEIWRGGDRWERVVCDWEMTRKIETTDNKYFTPKPGQNDVDALIEMQTAFGYQLIREGLERVLRMQKLKESTTC